jgi:hypothetical protein
MNTYLTIITTVLVITQIIRLIQNAMQLTHLAKTKIDNAEVVQAWKELKSTMENLAKRLEGGENED